LRARTIGLALAVLLPAFALAAGLLWSMELQARRVLNDQILNTARALSLVVDREIGERSATIDALAVSPYLKKGDFRNFDRQAREALASTDAWIVVNDANYNPLVNTRTPLGASLPKINPAGATFAGERRSGLQVTNLMIGSVTRKPIVGVSRSVTLSNGKTVGLAIITFAKHFDDIFHDQGLPPQWTGAILDAQDKVVARSRASDAHRGRLATPDLQAALRKSGSGVIHSRTYDGISVVLAYRRLPGYNWSVLVAAPTSEMSLVGGGALAWSTLLAVLLLGLAVLLAMYAAGRIEAPVRQLAIAASQWRTSKPPKAVFENGPAEIRALAAAFGETVDALEIVNRRLSTQVSARTEEFERIWRLSRDGFVIADHNGVWRRASPAWGDLLGWNEAELIGRTSEWIEHPDDRENIKINGSLAAVAAKARFTNRLRARNGEYRWFSWTVVADRDRRYYIARDITAEKEAAIELESTQEALRQSQKLDAIGRLTGGVAHDFNNLLTPILGALDIVQRRAQLSERDSNLLSAAAEAADRARTLVQRLLAFARQHPLQPQSVDIVALLQGAATLIGSIVGSGVKLDLELPHDLPAARADPNELEMAVLNLAANARDAMPDGGVIRIRADVRTPADNELEGCARMPYVVITVSDTGSGMDEETLARAVEPFFSTKGVGKGTGLGLSMVHGLVAQLGGAVTLKSTVGAGTTVELWLPTTQMQISNQPAAEPAADFNASGVVLLVDDEPLVRLTTGDMLTGLGFSVVDVGSAQEALALVEEGLQPRFLVTDHLMPGMTGAELALKFRALHPETPVLIITGYAEQKDLPEGVPNLRKPFRQSELANQLYSLN